MNTSASAAHPADLSDMREVMARIPGLGSRRGKHAGDFRREATFLRIKSCRVLT